MTTNNNVNSYNRTIEEMVKAEVIYCLSGLVTQALQAEYSENGPIDGITYEAMNNLWSDECGCEKSDQTCPHNDPDFDPDYDEPCDNRTENEVISWWLVTDWFFKHLNRLGEVTMQTDSGLYLWGRNCHGQSIAQDGIIEQLYHETHSDDWKLVRHLTHTTKQITYVDNPYDHAPCANCQSEEVEAVMTNWDNKDSSLCADCLEKFKHINT